MSNDHRPKAQSTMSGSTIEELLVEFSEPLTEGEYRSRREHLLLAFQEQHKLYSWSEIEKAIRSHTIEESMLVEEWLELRTFTVPLESLRADAARVTRLASKPGGVRVLDNQGREVFRLEIPSKPLTESSLEGLAETKPGRGIE